jgi:putative transcriptional regulator
VNVQERLEVGDRPVDALLAGYAAGTLSVPMAALVAARLELKPADRAFVSALEAAYGVFLEEIEPVALSERDRKLAEILTSENGRGQARASSLRSALNGETFNGRSYLGTNYPDEDEAEIIDTVSHGLSGRTLPMSLQKLIGRELEDLSWRAAGNGIKQSIISADGMEEVSLVNWRAGHRTPTHGHFGLEAMLVLKGGFSDGIGEYRRGDVSVADESIEHKPIALPGEDCVVYVVREAPVKILGTMNRFIQMLIGR